MTGGELVTDFILAFKEFFGTLPQTVQTFITLFSLVLLVVIYAVFVWRLHISIGTKNIFQFNLNKYNNTTNPVLAKILASFFYMIEYIFIIPFIVFFWFTVFTFFLIFLIEEEFDISVILLISAVAVSSIRMASYIPRYGENVARELAKVLPITFLGVAVLNPAILTNFATRAVVRLLQISQFVSGVLNFFFFIVVLEIILRFFEFLFYLMGIDEVEEREEGDKI